MSRIIARLCSSIILKHGMINFNDHFILFGELSDNYEK